MARRHVERVRPQPRHSPPASTTTTIRRVQTWAETSPPWRGKASDRPATSNSISNLLFKRLVCKRSFLVRRTGRRSLQNLPVKSRATVQRRVVVARLLVRRSTEHRQAERCWHDDVGGSKGLPEEGVARRDEPVRPPRRRAAQDHRGASREPL